MNGIESRQDSGAEPNPAIRRDYSPTAICRRESIEATWPQTTQRQGYQSAPKDTTTRLAPMLWPPRDTQGHTQKSISTGSFATNKELGQPRDFDVAGIHPADVDPSPAEHGNTAGLQQSAIKRRNSLRQGRQVRTAGMHPRRQGRSPRPRQTLPGFFQTDQRAIPKGITPPST